MSYKAGVGDSYRMMSDVLFAQLGFTSDRCFENPSDPTLEGKHDSRGLFDKLLQVSGSGTVPEIVRKTRHVTSAPLEESDYLDIKNSNNRLAERNNNQWWITSTSSYPTFGFSARKVKGKIELISVSDTLIPSDSFIENEKNGDTRFTFKYRAGGKGTLKLPKLVTDKITGNETNVGVTYIRIASGTRNNFFVDNVLVDSIDLKLTKVIKINDYVGCSSLSHL
jgi:hypothetical protein